MIAQNSFKRNVELKEIFMDSQHKEIIARLKFVINIHGILVLYGEPGSGKSTIIRIFNSQLDTSKYCICYINNSNLTPRDLYSTILDSLSVIPYSLISKLKKQFYDVLSDIYNNHKKQVIVFIDNAQALPIHTINELRYLLNFKQDSMSPLTLILIGQSELMATLRLRSFEPLFYRISSKYQLHALSQKQTSEYIIQQLKLSNLSMLFPKDITAKIWGKSKGLPQIINTICKHCLIDMEANSLNLVDNSVLERVLADLQY
jgi:type II secretory pathway predicted ATPase ExeA